MNSRIQNLRDLLMQWEEWSKTADQSEDGWEVGFPEWASLIASASMLMTHQDLTNEEIQMLEKCWKMSEEGEDLADYAKANLMSCWKTITRLLGSHFPEVRWQIYEVLGEADCLDDSLLRKGLNDEDPYCRRRAILSLAKLAPHDAKEIAALFLDDSDPYIRQAARSLCRP